MEGVRSTAGTMPGFSLAHKLSCSSQRTQSTIDSKNIAINIPQIYQTMTEMVEQYIQINVLHIVYVNILVVLCI